MLQLHGKIPFVFEQDFGKVFDLDLERSFWDRLTDWREDAFAHLFSNLGEAVRHASPEGRTVEPSFSVAASKAQDILKMTDVDLNDLDLPTSPSSLPRGCVEWLERVNSTFVGSGESCEAAARQQIDPILHVALPEKSGITGVQNVVQEVYVAVGLAALWCSVRPTSQDDFVQRSMLLGISHRRKAVHSSCS